MKPKTHPALPSRTSAQQGGTKAIFSKGRFVATTSVRLNKWPEMAAHVSNLEATARGDGFELLPLAASAALASFLLPWCHRGPFNRIIAAVAQEEALPLVSSDVAFDDVTVSRVWAGAGV